MWWPLFEIDGSGPRIQARFKFQPVVQDIESLNLRAEREGDLEVTAASCAQYPAIEDRYALLACGSSMGENYGPKLVACQPMTLRELESQETIIAVPGERTSAFATLRLMMTRPLRHACVPFDEIIERVAAGEFRAGVVIHEGQLLYERAGLHLVADLGAWWTQRTGLPLPLGVNVIRRDLDDLHGPGATSHIARLLQQSVEYALTHRDESIAYALKFARDMAAADADRFISMYVNRWSVEFGVTARQAVERFLSDCAHRSITTRLKHRLEVIEGSMQKSERVKLSKRQSESPA